MRTKVHELSGVVLGRRPLENGERQLRDQEMFRIFVVPNAIFPSLYDLVVLPMHIHFFQ